MVIKKYFPYILLLIISILFFYKFFFFAKIPFPGDLLITEYAPWNYDSFLGFNPGAIPNKAQYFDVIRQIYPWKMFSIEQFLAGQFPLWNPYNFSGSPLLANNQSAPFYPLNVLLIIPKSIGWSLYIFSQSLLSLIFTYLYARRIGLSIVASIFSSLAFSFSLYMSTFLEYGNFGHTILWLPITLFAIESFNNSKKAIYLLLLAFSIAASCFAGHFQLFGGVILFSIIYIFWLSKLKKNQIMRKFYLTLALIFGVFICSIQLFPMFELTSNSSRVSLDLLNFKNNILIQGHQLVLFFSPDIYGNPATRSYLLNDAYPGNALYVGVSTFFLSILSSFQYRKNSYVKFYILTIFVVLLFATNNLITNYIFSLNLPFLSSSSPSNLIFLISFSLAILAGFGFDKLNVKAFKDIYLSLLFITFFVVCTLGLNYLSSQEFLIKQLFLNLGIFLIIGILLLIIKFTKKIELRLLLIIILFFDLFYYFQKFNPFVEKELLYPETNISSFLKNQSEDYYRFYGYGSASIESNFATQFKAYSADGYDPLYPYWYGKFIDFSKKGKIENVTYENRSDAKISNGFGEMDIIDNKYRLKVLDLIGVKYILDRVENNTTQKSFPDSQFRLSYKNGDWKVIENLNVLPRSFTTTSFDTYSSDWDFQEKFRDNKAEVLLEKKPRLSINKSDKIEEAEILEYNPNNVLIKTSNTSNSLLFLSDTFYPGWEATIDGKNIEILKANYAFRAVEVPGGNHIVEFSYFPKSFVLGLYTSIISLVTLFIFFLTIQKYGKNS